MLAPVTSSDAALASARDVKANVNLLYSFVSATNDMLPGRLARLEDNRSGIHFLVVIDRIDRCATVPDQNI